MIVERILVIMIVLRFIEGLPFHRQYPVRHLIHFTAIIIRS